MRIVVIGEGMLELANSTSGWALGYGGDTLNTAVHLARLGHDVAYLTALGSDPFSAELTAAWAAEGLDTSLILTDPTRSPGLYAIRTDATGERSFHYWRDNSAARGMFDLPGIEAALDKAQSADLIIYSLITLAILPPQARIRLLSLCRHLRAIGGKVAFDGNYRPRLWPDAQAAIAARDAALAEVDFGFPSLDDEQALQPGQTADAIAAHWTKLGVTETPVKLGPQGCRLPNGTILLPTATLTPVDTSGAGDAFNAGYLHARLSGAAPHDAALAGHDLAAWVIMRPGAIPARG